jgi:aminoglycoside phosphotransferase (APT) family kinase protein
MSGSPPAQGVRLPWAAVPVATRSAFERWAGASVVSADSQPGGFSPGVASRLTLADGRAFFVKAVGPEPNAESPTFHRREARIVAALPDGIAVPRLRWWLDDADTRWVVLAFDAIHGRHPAEPWRLDELDRILEALATLAAQLTPSPLSRQQVRSASDIVATSLCGWQMVRQEPYVAGLDDWSRRHLEALAILEAQAPNAVAGDTLLHFDVRADNILLDDRADRVWLVDWPHAAIGAAWLDVVGFAPSVAMQGGPHPEELFARVPGAADADSEAVNAGLAAVAGYFTRQSLLPPPPGIPTVRAFQAAQGTVARQWLAARTGWR